jgi:GGDEF domain-containing protein
LIIFLRIIKLKNNKILSKASIGVASVTPEINSSLNFEKLVINADIAVCEAKKVHLYITLLCYDLNLITPYRLIIFFD